MFPIAIGISYVVKENLCETYDAHDAYDLFYNYNYFGHL